MFGATEIYFGTKVKIDKRLRDEILKEFSGETIRYHYEVMKKHNREKHNRDGSDCVPQ